MKNILFASALAVMLSASSVSGLKSAPAAANFLWTTTLAPSTSVGYGVEYNGMFFVQAQNTGADANIVLYAVDASTGIQRWNITTSAATGEYVAAGSDNIFSGTHNTLYAYDYKTGNTMWSFTPPATGHNKNLSDTWPAKPTYCNGRVYVTWYDTQLYALDAKTGVVLYKTEYYVGGRIWTSSDCSTLYFMTQDTMTAGYSSAAAKSADGSLMWSTPWPATGGFDTSIANDHGFASRVYPDVNNTWKKYIIGLNKNTGAQTWIVNGTDLNSSGGFDYNIMNDRMCTSFQNSLSTYTLSCYTISSGLIQWTVNLPTTDNSINMAAGDDFVLVYGYNSGTMFAYDYNGNPIWTPFNTIKPWYGSVSNGAYFFGHYSTSGETLLSAVQVGSKSSGTCHSKGEPCRKVAGVPTTCAPGCYCSNGLCQ